MARSIGRVGRLLLGGLPLFAQAPPGPVPAAPPYLLWLDPALAPESLLRSPFLLQVLGDALRLCAEDSLAGLGLQAHPGGWVLAAAGRDPGRLAEGAGLPRPEELASAMLRSGWQDRARPLRASLEDYPEWGEAWVLRLRQLGGQALRGFKRIRAGNPNASVAELAEGLGPAFWREAAEGLCALGAVPDWWESPSLSLSLALLGPGLGADPALAEAWRRLSRQVAAALRDHPFQEGAWRLSILLEQAQDFTLAAGAPDRPQAPARILANLQAVTTAPGDPWPDPRLAKDLLSAVCADPEVLLNLGDWALDAVPAQPAPAQAEAQAAWAALRIHALIQLERPQEVRLALAAQREQLGSAWPRLGEVLRSSLWFQGGTQDAALLSLLNQEPLPPPPAAREPEPLRLEYDPAQAPRWRQLAAAEPLRAWAPSELRWLAQPAEPLACAPGVPQPAWRLLAGSLLQAQGHAVPTEPELTALLRAVRPPRLEQLNRFAARHPEHLGVRSARLRWLLARPDAADFLPVLLEDADSLMLPPPTGLRPPDRAARELARRQLPRLEAKLRAWPNRVELWQAWASWWLLAGDPDRAGRLLRALPERGALGEAGPLPLAAAKPVAKRLREGSASLAAAWSQALKQVGCPALGER